MHLENTKKCALIVDDDKAWLNVVHATLVNKGITHYIASTPEQAIELAKKHKPKVVLMDYRMPNCNGIKLIGHLMEVLQHTNTEYILVTGDEKFVEDTNLSSLNKSSKVQLHSVISKPLNNEMICNFLINKLD